MNVVPGGWARAALHTRQLVRDPIALMRALSARHGPTFWLSLLDGPSVVTGDPDHIRAIFAADPEQLDAPNEIAGPLVGQGSIVLANGEVHRRKRRLLVPPFHGERMRSYGAIIEEATRRAFAGLVPGRPVALLEATQRLSLEVILRAVFGVSGEPRLAEFRKVVVDNIEAFPAWLMFLPTLHRGRVGPWARYQRRVSELRSLLLEQVAAGRAAPGEDVLSLLIAARDEDGEPMSDDELCAELRTLVIAGHETTSTTLAWALDKLHRRPDALDRLRAEVAGTPTDKLARLPWLQAVCNEALRMHPVSPVLRRRVVRSWRMGPDDLPAGTVLSPAVAMTHFDPVLYPEPDAFRPERFVDGPPGPGAFFPFGGGARRCVGAAFAQWELAIALATVVREHRFEPPTAPIPRLCMNGITTRPARPLSLRYGGSAVTES